MEVCKVLFLIWRFNKKLICNEKWFRNGEFFFKEFDVENSHDKLIAIQLLNEIIQDTLFEKIVSFISEKKSSNVSLVLCHNKPESIIDKAKKAGYNLFSGGEGDDQILYNKIITASTWVPNAFIKDRNGNKILKLEIFKDIWNEYSYKKKLERAKKQIINIWLPLAIDIQGLSEVQDDTTKAASYFEEIKKETAYLKLLESFPKDDEFPRWEEIKNELKEGYKEFEPKSLAEAIQNAISFNEFKKDFLKQENESKQPNPHFLPNWLQEVVNVIDKKIEESSKLVEEK